MKFTKLKKNTWRKYIERPLLFTYKMDINDRTILMGSNCMKEGINWRTVTAWEGTTVKCLYWIRYYSERLQFLSHITHIVTIFLPTLSANKNHGKILKHLKSVLDKELAVLVEKDFVTMFNGFRIAVNVDCKPHPPSTWTKKHFFVYNNINSQCGTLLDHMITYLQDLLSLHRQILPSLVKISGLVTGWRVKKEIKSTIRSHYYHFILSFSISGMTKHNAKWQEL